MFSDHTRILTPVFRHLFLYLITAPLSLFGRRILEIGGPWPYWCFLLTFFSAVMAGAVMLVHATLSAVQGAGRGTAVAGTALFFSFSYTWLLAACPESYPLACLAGLLVLRWGLVCIASRGKVKNFEWLRMLEMARMDSSVLCGVQGDSSPPDGGWGKATESLGILARAYGERNRACASNRITWTLPPMVPRRLMARAASRR